MLPVWENYRFGKILIGLTLIAWNKWVGGTLTEMHRIIRSTLALFLFSWLFRPKGWLEWGHKSKLIGAGMREDVRDFFFTPEHFWSGNQCWRNDRGKILIHSCQSIPAQWVDSMDWELQSRHSQLVTFFAGRDMINHVWLNYRKWLLGKSCGTNMPHLYSIFYLHNLCIFYPHPIISHFLTNQTFPPHLYRSITCQTFSHLRLSSRFSPI